ncbi:unnamed protein product [Commensalibacter papalotli (ex Botero et al. 2024)]|nr:unnamed protein product [Commensalibacter papalotli (ex Botero et al. 2024)]
MKKIFYLLFSLSLTSCTGADWNLIGNSATKLLMDEAAKNK